MVRSKLSRVLRGATVGCAPLVLAAVAAAQYDVPVALDSISQPQGLYAADLDGDGDPDALATSLGAGEVLWYEHLGSGAFGPAQLISSAVPGASDVHAQDLDGDGDLDVLSAASGSGELAWYANFGGTFGPAQVIGTLTEPWCVTTCDLDGDGDYDAFAACKYTNKVVWYENLGGSFGPEQLITASAHEPYTVRCADVDGDGWQDVLAAGFLNGDIVWVRGLGDGSFGSETLITGTANGVRSIDAGDMDGDGDVDVVSDSADTYYLYENAGSGAFGAPTPLGYAPNAWSVHIIDVEGDGDNDVLYSAVWAEEVGWIENDGDGSFDRRDLGFGAVGDRRIHGADFDLDGDADVLTVSRRHGRVEYHHNLLDEAFGELHGISTSDGEALRVVSFDYDHDGDADVFSSSFEGPSTPAQYLYRYENLGAGVFGPGQQVGTSSNFIYELYLADLSGDGEPDLVYRCDYQFGAHNIAWFRNLGAGAFGPEQVVTTLVDGPSSIAFADWGGDGDLDVFCCAENENALVWFENLGGGSFGPKQNLVVNLNQPQAVRAADMDGDGDSDLVVSPYLHALVVWYENLGTGAVAAHSLPAAPSYSFELELADLDGDGWMDILRAEYFTDKAGWIRNLSGSGFAPEVSFAGHLLNVRELEAVDLDLDGDLDVVALPPDASSVFWFENEGGGLFGGMRAVTTAARFPSSAVPADVDGDGDADLLIAAYANGRVGWCENLLELEPQVFCEGRFACPCGNNSPPGTGRGCVNATGIGAHLTASGTPSVSADTLQLTVHGATPNEFGIFVQNLGPAAGVGFYDGFFCMPADAHLIRHYSPPLVQPTLTNGAGVGTNAQALTLGDFLGDTAPGVRVYYQYWYRDNTGPCLSGANFSGGLSVYWRP